MTIKSKVTLLICIGISIPPLVPAFAQNQDPDTAFLAQAQSQAVSGYADAMNRQLRLYNGSEYNPYPDPYEDYPYFGSEYWEEGSVEYYGEWYEGVMMQYDLYNDVLVIEHYDQKGYMAEVALHSEKVDHFDLLGHRFIRIAPDSAETMNLRPGFYDLLHDGRNKVLCKRRKMVQEEIESGTLRIYFREGSNLYLIKDGQVYPLRNKRSLLKALSDKKRMLKQFVRREVTDFGNKEKMLVDMVRYYDSLK